MSEPSNERGRGLCLRIPTGGRVWVSRRHLDLFGWNDTPASADVLAALDKSGAVMLAQLPCGTHVAELRMSLDELLKLHRPDALLSAGIKPVTIPGWGRA